MPRRFAIRLRNLLVAAGQVLLPVLLFAAEPPRAIPFDFANNQIFVKVGVNDATPSWFIVDSGASGCVLQVFPSRST